MVQRLLIVFASAFCVSVFAAENNVLSLKPEIQRGDLGNPQGLWPFIGLGLGVTDSNTTIRTGGVPMHLKVLGSYYFEGAPWVADAGIGLHNEFLTQSGKDSDTIQSLYTEFAGRYKFTNRWQLGAIWNTLVDNPDRYHSNTENLASFIGVQALKEFTWNKEYLVRVGGRAMTDVGISNATVDTIMAELQVSFGPSQQSNPNIIRVEETRPETIAPHLARHAMQTIEIDARNVNFESASTKPVRSSQLYLKRLARALSDNRHLFDKVEVIGHADQRGPDRYNDKLSQRRAQAISDTLISAGLSRKQVNTQGRGKRQPLSSAMSSSAMQRNRRVELEFEGVKNQEALKNVIDSVSR